MLAYRVFALESEIESQSLTQALGITQQYPVDLVVLSGQFRDKN